MERKQYSKEEKAEFAEKLRQRTKLAALAAVRLFQHLPKTEEARILGRQMIRSATSTAANYRAVCRARSPQEQFAKLSITIEEADETLMWLELLRESEIITPDSSRDLEKEFNEFIFIFAKARFNSK